jgi:predicted Zn finger-like uncharacterized protein
MIAACPHCGVRYRIEPARIPAQGAHLRCSRCEAIFRVSAPAPERPAPPSAAGPRSGTPPSEVPAKRAAERPRSEAEPSGVPTGQAAAQGRPQARPLEPARRPLVLVADPDVGTGKALAGALAAWGLEPILVHDGVEAILTIQRTLPRLVVLEAGLPKMLGFQVCELMKRNEQLRSIPVVLVEAVHHRERYRRQAAETYGADAYVERPEFAGALRELLRRFGIVARGAGEAAAAARAERPLPAPGERARPTPVAPPVAARAAAGPDPAPASSALPRPPADPALAAEVAKAERLARIIVSDIVLYNPEKFEAALRTGNVAEAMAPEMEEGRAHFRERIAERIRERKDFLGEELVRVARLRGMR